MEDILVNISQGKLRGKTLLDYKGRKYYCFRGIPYAKQPVGELRFKPPQPPDSWKGIRDCTVQERESLSRHLIYQFKIGSECCLYLNVYTPELPGRESGGYKSVMVYIHGGGFVQGSSKNDIYGPDFLMTGDIVLVTIQYRLGILGFLSLEDASLNIPGNNGLKDIVQALQWIQENIHAFNGDPGCVTIFGNSSGAAAVHLLMLSPLSEGLFHRAILQSGTALNPWVPGTRCAKQIADVLKLEAQTEKEILEILKTLPEEKFIEAQDAIPDGIGISHNRPHGFVVEKPTKEPNFLIEEPLSLMLSGKYSKVPVMIGYTNREGMYCEIRDRLVNGGFKLFSDFETRVPYFFNVPKGSDLSKRIAQKIKEFYFQNNNPTYENIEAFYLLHTDIINYRAIYTTLKHHLKNSEHPTYFYRYSADTGLNWSKKFGHIQSPGAAHMDELGALFKTTFLPNIKDDSEEDILIQRMVKLWTNFAKTGNPNQNEQDSLINVIWKPAKDCEFFYLDIGNELKMGSNPDLERMLFWDDIIEMCPAAKNM